MTCPDSWDVPSCRRASAAGRRRWSPRRPLPAASLSNRYACLLRASHHCCCPSQARKIRQHLMQLGVPPPPASAAPSCSPAAASLAAEPSPSAPLLLTAAVGSQQEPDPHTCFQPDDLQRYQNLRDHSAKLQDLQVGLGQGGRESAHACCHSRVHNVLCYPPIILLCASPCCVCVLPCDIVFAACSQGVPG